MLRRQDLSCTMFYLLGYSSLRKLLMRLKGRPETRFVIFHDVLPEAVECFRKKLIYLKRTANVVSLDDFFEGRLRSDRLNIGLTFDDGYTSWATTVLPILQELRLPAAFFVSSGFVGLDAKESAEFARSHLFLTMGHRRISGCLSHEQLARISRSGFTIGGHTLHHRDLAKIRDRAEIQREIAEDKRRLEGLTGRRVDYFAYPVGAFDNPDTDVPAILAEVGYKGAVITMAGMNTSETNPYLLRRELAFAQMSGLAFRARASGNYDAVNALKKLFGYQAYEDDS